MSAKREICLERFRWMLQVTEVSTLQLEQPKPRSFKRWAIARLDARSHERKRLFEDMAHHSTGQLFVLGLWKTRRK